MQVTKAIIVPIISLWKIKLQLISFNWKLESKMKKLHKCYQQMSRNRTQLIGISCEVRELSFNTRKRYETSEADQKNWKLKLITKVSREETISTVLGELSLSIMVGFKWFYVVLDGLSVFRAFRLFKMVLDGFSSYLYLAGEKVQHIPNLISFDIKRLSHHLWKAIAIQRRIRTKLAGENLTL